MLVFTAAHADEYRYDTEHSQILASADHDGFSHPVARLKIARGWLRFDERDWSRAGTELDIDLATIDFGDAKWNATLRESRWLDSGRQRYAHFASAGVVRGEGNNGVLRGTLTLRGVSRPVDVHFHLNRVATTVFGMHRVAGFSATARFRRSDFGMRANPRSVGGEVDLRLEIEAIRDDNAEREYHQPEHAHAAKP
jgi:polyisoprenoid-binding protein YceI